MMAYRVLLASCEKEEKDNIVEGTFEMNAINYQDGTTKAITDGKFRMKYGARNN